MAFKYVAVFALLAVAAATPVLLESDSPAKYDFSYSVHDTETGDIKQQQEVRDGDNVSGQYSLVDADGLHRIVDYTADEVNGFQATVRREPITKPLEQVVHKVAHVAVAAPVVHKTVAVAAAAPVTHVVSHAAPAAVTHYSAAPAVHYTAAPVAHYAPAPVTHYTQAAPQQVVYTQHAAPVVTKVLSHAAPVQTVYTHAAPAVYATHAAPTVYSHAAPAVYAAAPAYHY